MNTGKEGIIGRRSAALPGKSGQILAELISKFDNGDYRFGQSLSINALAKEFDASRQPVTTAVNHLSSLGYVIITPQVGCRVVAPSKSEISDFFYMLGKVEGALACFAANRWQAKEEMDALSGAMKIAAATPFDTPDHRVEYARAVDNFHDAIHQMAESPSAVRSTLNLWHLADFYLWQGADKDFSPRQMQKANRERKAIARAIKKRDAELAETLMAEHVSDKPRRVGIV